MLTRRCGRVVVDDEAGSARRFRDEVEPLRMPIDARPGASIDPRHSMLPTLDRITRSSIVPVAPASARVRTTCRCAPCLDRMMGRFAAFAADRTTTVPDDANEPLATTDVASMVIRGLHDDPRALGTIRHAAPTISGTGTRDIVATPHRPSLERPRFERPGFERPGFTRPDLVRPGFMRPDLFVPAPMRVARAPD